jgi:hypothetical protein
VTRDEKREIAEQSARDTKPRASGWHRGPCGFCEAQEGRARQDPTFSFNPTTGAWHCFRCHTGGSLDPSDEWADLAAATPEDSTEARTPPEGFLPLGFGDGATAWCTKKARAYLAKRGVAPAAIKALGIGCTLTGKYADRIVLPVLDPEDRWVGWVARDYTGKHPKKYLNARGSWRGDILYNQRAIYVETDEPVLVVEGGFDACPFGADGAAALLGKPTESQINLIVMGARRPVCVVLDGDAWQEGEALALRFRMEGLRAGSVRLGPKIDPDQISVESLMNRARISLDADQPT